MIKTVNLQKVFRTDEVDRISADSFVTSLTTEK